MSDYTRAHDLQRAAQAMTADERVVLTAAQWVAKAESERDRLRAEVEAVIRDWEQYPALRRGTAAAEMRRALHRADAARPDTQHEQEAL